MITGDHPHWGGGGGVKAPLREGDGVGGLGPKRFRSQFCEVLVGSRSVPFLGFCRL